MDNEILEALIELGLTPIDWVDACQFAKLTGIEEAKLTHRRKKWPADYVWSEPYRVCRRVNILRDYSDEKTKLYPRN